MIFILPMPRLVDVWNRHLRLFFLWEIKLGSIQLDGNLPSAFYPFSTGQFGSLYEDFFIRNFIDGHSNSIMG